MSMPEHVPESLILPFARDRLLSEYPLVGLFQVGSSVRGYSLDKSDIDLMAFYHCPQHFRAFPEHTQTSGIQITLEHHGLTQFLRENGDYAVNPGSLRQMHKVRDGRLLLGTLEDTLLLRTAAAESCLDPRPLLYYLAQIATRFGGVRGISQQAQHQTLLSWTEMISTLSVMSKRGGPAYSKPKWLLRALTDAAMSEASNLILQLYGPATPDRLTAGLHGLHSLYSQVQVQGVAEPFRRLVTTAINDAEQMTIHEPTAAFPSLRFATIQVWRSLHGETPLRSLARGNALPVDVMSALGGKVDLDLESDWSRFLRFFTQTFDASRDESLDACNTAIGTRRLMTHLLETYDGTELFPYVSELPVRRWIDQIGESLLAIQSW